MRAIIAAAIVLLLATSATAQPAAEFYKGKQITLIVGSTKILRVRRFSSNSRSSAAAKWT